MEQRRQPDQAEPAAGTLEPSAAREECVRVIGVERGSWRALGRCRSGNINKLIHADNRLAEIDERPAVGIGPAVAGVGRSLGGEERGGEPCLGFGRIAAEGDLDRPVPPTSRDRPRPRPGPRGPRRSGGPARY